MKTKVQKWGNSYAIRLPIKTIKKQNIFKGSWLDIKEKKGKIILDVLEQREEENLESLVNKINSDNLHQESDWGDVCGKEIW